MELLRELWQAADCADANEGENRKDSRTPRSPRSSGGDFEGIFERKWRHKKGSGSAAMKWYID